LTAPRMVPIGLFGLSMLAPPGGHQQEVKDAGGDLEHR